MKALFQAKPTRAAELNRHDEVCRDWEKDECGCCLIHICRRHRAEHAEATLKINAEILAEPDYAPGPRGDGYLPYRGLRIERTDEIDQHYGYDGFYVTKGPNQYGTWVSIANFTEDRGCVSGSGPIRYRSLAQAKMVADKYVAEQTS